MLRFTVYGEAQPAGSKRAGLSKKGKLFVRDDNPNSKEWKRQVQQAAGNAMVAARLDLMTGPIQLRCVFYRVRPKGHFGTGRNAGKLKDSAPAVPITKPDLLKVTRGIEDAMTGVVYRDDAQIWSEELKKRYGERARVEIEVSEG